MKEAPTDLSPHRGNRTAVSNSNSLVSSQVRTVSLDRTNRTVNLVKVSKADNLDSKVSRISRGVNLVSNSNSLVRADNNNSNTAVSKVNNNSREASLDSRTNNSLADSSPKWAVSNLNRVWGNNSPKWVVKRPRWVNHPK